MTAPTKLLYLEEMQALTAQASVLDVYPEDGHLVAVLDQTIFYPQGGGQPYDTGTIEGPNGTFQVDEARFVDGVVKHIGGSPGAALSVGEAVTCHVDPARRALHARLHSAAHVLDMSLAAMGVDWIPGKGYHFPDGPYVEYAGTLEGVDKEQLRQELEKRCNEYIGRGITTNVRFMPKEEMHTVCRHVPDYLPAGKPTRVVMYGDFGVPCGGTHVTNLADIKDMHIGSIKMKSGVVRVRYEVVA